VTARRRLFNNLGDGVGGIGCDNRSGTLAGGVYGDDREGATVRRRRRASGDEGVAAVEFALLLPLLALLVCGVVDLGRWFSAWNETKNAAREGAAYAQVFPYRQTAGGGPDCADPNNVTARARQELGSAASSSFGVSVVPPATGCGMPTTRPSTVAVTVTRKVPLITPIIKNLVGDVDITATVQAKVQG
jgi:Flp pilus assembly pilin Flp